MFLVLCLWVCEGKAQPGARLLPDRVARETARLKLRFVEKNKDLHVTDGVRSASLGMRASTVLGSTYSKELDSLTVEYEWSAACVDEKRKQVFPVAQLHAHLENAAALKQHRRGVYAESELGFAKAVALFPTFKKAVFNLACAQTRQDKRETALSTLAGHLHDAPAETYAQIAGDPDLTPLLETPVLKAMRSREPGNGRIEIRRGEIVHPPVLMAKEKRLLATSVKSESWGSASYSSALIVFDVDTRKQLFARPLVEDEVDPDTGSITQSGRKAVATRLQGVNRFLADFGFSAVGNAEAGRENDNGTTMRFPKARLGVVLSMSKIRVVRKNDVLREADWPNSKLRQGWYLAGEGLFLLTWHIDEPEGCDCEQDLAGAELIDIKTP